MAMVNRAMRTQMLNSPGVITPSDKPTLSTISSVRPRLFISQPRATVA